MQFAVVPEQGSGRSDSVRAAIRMAILSHTIAPGTKLPEDELAGIYGVSRTIVRSALQGLSHDGLVELEPNRGAFVAKPTPAQAREVFEARALMEPQVAALAAKVATHADAERLASHIEREHEAINAGNDGEALVLSAQFHVAIAEVTGNAIFAEYVRDLCSRSSLIIALYWRRRDTTCESHAHHALLDAIAEHRPDDAFELMNSHLVDLLSGLDLRDSTKTPTSLADALRS